jgi:hypothetical protein
MKKGSVVVLALLIAISALYDFYRGYSHDKSIAEGSLSVILGFVILACFWWLFSRRNSN